MSRKGARRIVVSAASKLPSSKAGPGISRVDIYVNNRPVRSIDAREGVVPSTQVTIGKAGNKPVTVEARRGTALEDLSHFVGRPSDDPGRDLSGTDLHVDHTKSEVVCSVSFAVRAVSTDCGISHDPFGTYVWL